MGALRLVLLGAGLLFLALLAWLGSRRPRRVRRDDMAAPAARSEPRFGAAAPSDEWEVSPARELGGAQEAAAAAPLADAGGAMGVDPPVIEWSHVAPVGEGVDEALVTEVPVYAASGDERRGPPRGAQPPAPAPAPGSESELLVDWPPEHERMIVSLRILPERAERLSGRQLRQGLAAAGFRHGPFGIYHVAQDDGRVLFSAASLVRPGVLDPASMDFQQYPGVSLFAVLPAVIEPAWLLERMSSAAFELAARVAGLVQDETGAVLAPDDAATWRVRCVAALASREPAAGAP